MFNLPGFLVTVLLGFAGGLVIGRFAPHYARRKSLAAWIIAPIIVYTGFLASAESTEEPFWVWWLAGMSFLWMIWAIWIAATASGFTLGKKRSLHP